MRRTLLDYVRDRARLRAITTSAGFDRVCSALEHDDQPLNVTADEFGELRAILGWNSPMLQFFRD